MSPVDDHIRRDHEMQIVDVGDLQAHERDGLALRLRAAGIPHQLEDTSLRVPASEMPMVAQLIIEVGEVVASAGELPLFPDLADEDEEPEDLRDGLASPWRRLAAYVLEAILVSPLVAGVRFAAHNAVDDAVLGPAVGFASAGIGVAVYGRTIGMALTGMRVVVPPSRAAPGWRTALVRWAVVIGPGFVSLAVGVSGSSLPSVAWWALALVDLAWTIAVFGPILVDPYRRGLHDRVARTVVIRTRYQGPVEMIAADSEA